MTIGELANIDNQIELDYVTPSIAMETIIDDDEAETNSGTTPLFQAIKQLLNISDPIRINEGWCI